VSSDRITAIDDALMRLREYPERYGACEACGASIDLERLQVVPWTRHCREHVPSEARTHPED
jgi:RNA polymerase-binding transcription factor DksA